MPDSHATPASSGTFTLRMEPMGRMAKATPEQTVLQAALQAHIEWPNACRNGTCRSCLSRLLDGEIHYRIDWPGVSAEELSAGLFLPCVACAQTDLVIGLLSP